MLSGSAFLGTCIWDLIYQGNTAFVWKTFTCSAPFVDWHHLAAEKGYWNTFRTSLTISSAQARMLASWWCISHHLDAVSLWLLVWIASWTLRTCLHQCMHFHFTHVTNACEHYTVTHCKTPSEYNMRQTCASSWLTIAAFTLLQEPQMHTLKERHGMCV